MAGADTVMLGSLFAGTEEAPGAVVKVDGTQYKRSRGMATTAAAEDRDDKGADVGADEGVEALTPYKGPVAIVAEEFCQGIRSGLSYCGGHTIERARDRAEFIRVAPGAKERAGFHTDDDWEDQRGQRDEASLRLGRRNGGRKRRLTTEREPKGGFASTTGPRLRACDCVSIPRGAFDAVRTPSAHA